MNWKFYAASQPIVYSRTDAVMKARQSHAPELARLEPMSRTQIATRRIAEMWRGLKLSQQFLIVSAAATIAAMAVVGSWLTHRIEGATAQQSAYDAALYVESVVGERIQGMADTPAFDVNVQRELEQLVVQTPLGRRVLSFKVWAKGARVIYANNPKHIGKSYPATDILKSAWSGTLQYEFNSLNDTEDAAEKEFNVPLLEIYVPVRKRFGGDVIAVVEFYMDASTLVDEIARAKREAWLLLAIIGLLVVSALYGMAHRAGLTIDRQRNALNDRISDLSRLLDQNLVLRQRVEASSRRTAEINERYLRRIGSDLHDGPAQLISLSLFLLDAVHSGETATPALSSADSLSNAEKNRIREALQGALKEIRELSIGLSVPELDKSTIADTIYEAIRAHEHRAGTKVHVSLAKLPEQTNSRDTKLAIYRFLQEGLNNTRQHAPKTQVSVTAGPDEMSSIMIEIADEGPGLDLAAVENSDRLGLVGMRERIECIGGSLQIITAQGEGTRLVARLPVTPGDHHGP